jgi:hypothetical protein
MDALTVRQEGDVIAASPFRVHPTLYVRAVAARQDDVAARTTMIESRQFPGVAARSGPRVRGCRQLTFRSEACGCWTGRAAGVPSRLNWASVTSRSWLLTPVKVPPFVPATRAPLL